MRRLFIASVTAVLIAIVAALPVLAQGAAGGRCAERFPDTEFDRTAMAGSVAIHGSGIPEGILERYARDWGVLVDWVQEEMGGLDEDVAVCIFEDDIPIDAQALGWSEGQALRAAAFGDEGLLLLSNWFVAAVPDAGYNGLLHLAQYRVSDGEYPEPFGNDVKGWYRNRLDGSVEVVHNFYVRQNTGLSEPWAPFPWTVGRMVDPLLWNPEFDYGGGGDFTNFAVAHGGTEVLSDPLQAELEELDEEWRQSLFDESGAIPGGSRGWITGLIVSVGVVSLGILMAWWNRRQKRVMEERLRDMAWLEEQSRIAHEEEAVKTSVSAGSSRRDSRVGRGRARSIGRDRDDRDGSPSGGAVRSPGDRVSRRGEPGDDLFRHPDFDDDG